MDDLDSQILLHVQENARLSYAELGRRVGLSPPAVSERLARLESDGVITGYHAAVEVGRLGRPVQAVLHLQVDRARYGRSLERILDLDEILVCHRTTGSSSLLMIVAVASMQALEELIDQLLPLGEPVTQMILSTPVARRPIVPTS